MEDQIPLRRDKILILDQNEASLRAASLSIQEHFPTAAVETVSDINQCRQKISESNFDIVVVDYNLSGNDEIALVHQLKVQDYEPAVLLVSQTVDPELLNEINNLGCQRYLYKQGAWLNHLAPAVRQLLRIRRLEQENRRLVAQLTEAKMFLEEKNRRLDEFSATVAHDIRGPLGGISMKLEYLLEKYGDNLEDRIQLLMQRSFESSKRLVDIVQAMYVYAKLGSKATKMGEISLASLVTEVIEDMAFDDNLDIQIGLGDLPEVWGNADLLRRVFINLLGNAVKYNDKSPIIINIGVRKVIEKTLGNFVQIFLSDNGPGIPPDDQKMIFNMFHSGSTSSTSDSLGVGLAVVQRIVELHYGEITIESSPETGTTFLISLPVEKIDFLE